MKNNPNEVKLLVTEDNPELRSALVNKFKKAGFLTLQAEDGEKGLAVAMREHPDVLLLDVLMPKMDGLTMLKKIRSEGEWGAKVTVFILTNLSSGSEDVTRAVAANHFTHCLVKADWPIAEIVKKVKERLERT